MALGDSDTTATRARPSWLGRRPGAPPWLISVGLHVGLIVAFGLVLRSMPVTGAAGERTAEVGIALKQQDGEKEFFVSQDEAGRADASRPDAPAAVSRDQLFSDTTPGDPSEALPKAPPVMGLGAPGEEGVGDAAAATTGSTARGTADKGKARVRVFGTEGHGYKFAYVFDRSGSMAAMDGLPIRAAKAELINSLESLDRTHQFQIIFYNQEPVQFTFGGQAGRLNFGTERNKELARRFVGGIEPSGGTSHVKALYMALRLKPEVIFFLTDADEPRLLDHEIRQIARDAAGIMINAIEFGQGSKPEGDNFLARLARATGGQYRYVDISRLKIE
ncbi:MAG: hypothetical protein GX621_07295 [Pirellulaceae bacterium]|nr:hypothetical protein [Pirellulaceae bacterium]